MSVIAGNCGRLAILEAALYAAGRPLDIGHLKQILHSRSDKNVLKLVRELTNKYASRDSALEIKELPGGRIILQLRSKFSKMIRRVSNKPLLTGGPLKTLSFIAYHQPVTQMRVISERGGHIYGQLKMMEEMGLITRERTGDKEIVVRTTPYFSDYFGFSEDPQKTRLQLHRMFSRMKITKLDNGNGHEPPQAEEKLTEPSTGVEPLISTNSGDGLSQRLTQYPGAPDQGSK